MAYKNIRTDLTLLIEWIAVKAVDRAGVDAIIDLEQGHTDAIHIAPRQRPETSVGIAILRTNAGMHHEGAH